MNINDIMLRDMAEADRKQKREREMREYDREIRGRLWRRRFLCAINTASWIVAVAVLALLAWCCLSKDAHRWGIFGGSESRAERGCAPAK